MKQKIKNIFRKPTKKALGKLGLFLIFGIILLNFNFLYYSISDTKNIDTFEKISFQISISRVSAGFFDFADGLVTDLGSYGWGTPETDVQYSSKDAERQAAADGSGSGGNLILDWLLKAVNELLGYLVKIGAALLDAMLKPDLFNELIRGNRSGVYLGWTAVRDILNMFFMLLLLFSAFATIFQVEKYHLRKIIIMLIVMALLVNFSYPIAMFVIDFSNSAMYFLVERTFGGGAISKSAVMARLLNFGSVTKSINDANGGSATTLLLLNIVFNFILFITFISIGLNLLIRILAFLILLILSPAGFAFAFFPDTKSVASSWWSALFKYAFLGPIMVFFLYLAILLFTGASNIDRGFIVNTITFLVPIVFLWMGLIASQRFGGDGAGVAMSIARGTGNRVRRYSQNLAWGGTRMAGRGIDNAFGAPVAGTWNAVKNRWNQFGEDYKTASDRRAAEVGDRIGVRGANEKLVRENLKRLKEEGSSEAELTRLANGTVAERMASALFRAENNRFDNDPAIAQAQYNNAMNAVRGHQVYENQFLGNARKTNMDLVINERIAQSGANTPAAMQTIARDELGRLDPDQWRDQNIVRMVANTTPNRGTIIAEGANVISRYSQQGQDNVTRNMRGTKLDAGRHINNGGVGLWA